MIIIHSRVTLASVKRRQQLIWFEARHGVNATARAKAPRKMRFETQSTYSSKSLTFLPEG